MCGFFLLWEKVVLIRDKGWLVFQNVIVTKWNTENFLIVFNQVLMEYYQSRLCICAYQILVGIAITVYFITSSRWKFDAIWNPPRHQKEVELLTVSHKVPQLEQASLKLLVNPIFISVSTIIRQHLLRFLLSVVKGLIDVRLCISGRFSVDLFFEGLIA